MNTITIVEADNNEITKVVQDADSFINSSSIDISNQLTSGISIPESFYPLNAQENEDGINEDAAGYYYEMIAQQPRNLNTHK